tara:strand:+ start:1622 stop:1996 length:375 start_codon:yes stop_codon:yes gene_type:complete
MLIPIIARIDGTDYRGELNDSESAAAVAAALPLQGAASRWGDEYYWSIGIDADTADDARATFGVGELGYWPPGDAFCIFFGQTPASSGDEPVMASAGNPIGWITDDVTALRGTAGGASIEVRRA